MKIYVASSWRNAAQPDVVRALRAAGHEVYDFRNPRPGNHGFQWSEIDPAWRGWTPGEFRRALRDPVARDGYQSDMMALRDAEACVLVLPCGRSAHLEAGYAAGGGRRLIILIEGPCEPELMYRLGEIVLSIEELVEVLR